MWQPCTISTSGCVLQTLDMLMTLEAKCCAQSVALKIWVSPANSAATSLLDPDPWNKIIMTTERKMFMCLFLLAQSIPSLACSQVVCLMAKSRAWPQIQTLIARQIVFDPTRWGRSLDELSATNKTLNERKEGPILDAIQCFRMEYFYTIIYT